MPGQTLSPQYMERLKELSTLGDDELRGLTCLVPGQPLETREMYFDLAHPDHAALQGDGNLTVPDDGCFIAKGSVTEETWRKLTEGEAGPGMAD